LKGTKTLSELAGQHQVHLWNVHNLPIHHRD
jgi:hypothetical protein